MKPIGAFVVALALLGPWSAWHAAAQQPASSNADTSVKAAALEREARQIETMLIAPCCWREQVSVHQSEAADQVKHDIRAMLAARLTRQQVLDRFVGAYGARILAVPPDQGFSRILHHAPWAMGVLSLVGLGFFIRHATRSRRVDGSATAAPQRPQPAGADSTPADGLVADEAFKQRLDDELRDLD